ncbi:MAG TPA: acyltransferase family protein [Chryseosolibacter sp.]|nr:acyltransferase family protein [Chryseosolibacter sp.]
MNRRYDIDWLRTIAIGLLLIYHVAIGFQPWGLMIGFITNDESWSSLWLPMSMLNVWRIPFLFFVSGMGVYFAMQHRTWRQLIHERSLRILVPFVFGTVCIFPVSLLILQQYYGWETEYQVNPGHLWFLGNIFVYVIVLAPVFYYLKQNTQGKFVSLLRSMLRTPLGLIPFVGVFIAEVLIMKPFPYELYAMTWHGFALGFLAFFCGFCFVLCGDVFWKMITKWRWMFLILALGLFLGRSFVFGTGNPLYLLVVESDCWIFTVFAFSYRYLNRPGKALSYLSEAAYPVYINHMIFIYLGSWLIFPLEIPVWMKFISLLFFTVAGCFAAFECVRRVGILRVFFGLKFETVKNRQVHPRRRENAALKAG